MSYASGFAVILLLTLRELWFGFSVQLPQFLASLVLLAEGYMIGLGCGVAFVGVCVSVLTAQFLVFVKCDLALDSCHSSWFQAERWFGSEDDLQ